MKKILGIDIGGTTTKVGIIDKNGKIEHKFIINTSNKEVIKNLANECINKIEELGYNFQKDIYKISMAVPGFVDSNKGVVLLAPNVGQGWYNYDIKKDAEKFFNKKDIYILNDVNAAALGEYWIGAASKVKSALFYWLGTGIGGAIILNSKLITGSHGYAGEFGHGGSFDYSNHCNCGLSNCIEKKASAINFANHFINYLKKNKDCELNKYFKNVSKIDFKTIANVYKNNNKPQIIKDKFDEYFKDLYNHISIMIHALDPELIVIGGGASFMGDDLLNIIENGVSNKIIPLSKNVIKFQIASLKNDAGIIGSAYYAICEDND